MTSLVRHRPTVLIVALLAAYGPTWAAETIEAEGSVSIGVDGISGDSADP